MSEAFYNPYQFIPLDTRQAKRSTPWYKNDTGTKTLADAENHFVRHDYWHQDGVSGRIHCTLTTLSPTVVGGQQEQAEQADQPTRVKPYYHPSGAVAIPANSLRGLLGSVVETLSQSSLRVLQQAENGAYSVRKPAEQFLPHQGVLCQNRQFIQDKTTQTLYPVQPHALTVLETIMRTLVEKEQPAQRPQKQAAILRKFNRDKPERGWERNKDHSFSPLVLDGDLVYYRVEQGEVVELSYSSIWRKAVDGDLFEAFERVSGENSLPWHKKRTALTPAEALFGVVEDKPDKAQGGRHLASRVRFTDALPLKPVNLQPQVPLKILNSPKPPSPAMYFSGNGYVAKTDLDLTYHNPNGRKCYLPHPQSLQPQPQPQAHWVTDKENENTNMKVRVQPIPPQTTFQFEIQFENLSKEELGLLLKAIQPNSDTKTFVHRLGMGKPLGLGHVSIEPSVELIERPQRYAFAQWQQPRYQAVALADCWDDTLVDAAVLAHFVSLSNPQAIGETAVCYPYVTRYKKVTQAAYEEAEGFQWFSRNESTNKNERSNKQFLPNKGLRVLRS